MILIHTFDISGKTPFSALNTVQKLHAIPNPKYEILFPTHLNAATGACGTPSEADVEAAGGGLYHRIDVDGVESVRMCLIRDLSRRATIKGPSGLLSHSFLDLEAARVKWGSNNSNSNSTSTSNSTSNSNSNSTSNSNSSTTATPATPADRLSALASVQATLETQIGEAALQQHQLREEELQACAEILRAVRRAAPAAGGSGGGGSGSGSGSGSGGEVRDSPRDSSSGAPVTRRASRSTPLGHHRGGGASPAVVGNGSAATAAALYAAGAGLGAGAGAGAGAGTGAGAKRIMPSGLKDQILGADAGAERRPRVSSGGTQREEGEEGVGPITRHRLQKVEQSKANKWVKKDSPKNDMRSVLDKRFGDMRYVMIIFYADAVRLGYIMY
jgi:hypothetical protein